MAAAGRDETNLAGLLVWWRMMVVVMCYGRIMV